MKHQEPDGAEDRDGLPGLAERLNHLFKVVPKPDGGRYSNDTAAQALTESGAKVSSVHLSHLRTGRRTNPSARLLGAIATLFGVEIGYFFDSETERRTNADLDALKSVSEVGVRGYMARSGVSSKNIKHLDAILEAIRADLEQEREETTDDEGG